jgi:maleate isomerase
MNIASTNAASSTSVQDDMILLEHLPCELDGGIAERASVGLIVLATDYTVEHEWKIIFNQVPGVALYHSRIYNDDIITPESLRAMEPKITESTRLITPDMPLDVVAYGCTSASMAIGEERVFENIHKAKPEAKCTTPITGAFAAFKAFDAQRIGVLTPYPESVNRIVAKYMTDRGVNVPVFGSFNEDRDSRVSRISPESIEKGIHELIKHADVDAIFVSCTSVRLVEACRDLEKSLKLPITSSNHAMAWHTLRLAGINDSLPELGSLFTL